jgi:ubiquitin-protein ligase
MSNNTENSNNTNNDWVDIAPSLPSTTTTNQLQAVTVEDTTKQFTLPSNSNSTKMSAKEFLIQSGLTSNDATTIIGVLGAVEVEDFKIVDNDMANEAVRSLKLIPRKIALQALLGTTNADAGKDQNNITETKVEETNKDTTNKLETNAGIQECVAICLDHSGSMGCEFDETKAWNDDGNARAMQKVVDRRSRMDAVKQVFYAFRDRTETLPTKHELGLIQFDDEVETMLSLTSSLDLFEEIVDDVEKRGMTSIYSAIIEGVNMLRPKFISDPTTTDLRILLLTDGQSNSGASPELALKQCYSIGATVDCIIVGDTPDENLRKIVKLTGGSCFQIHSLSEGFELMESEAVVSLKARRGGTDKPPFVQKQIPMGGFANVHAQKITRGKAASSVAVKTITKAKKPVTCGALFSGSTKIKSSGAGSCKRIMKELADVAKGSSSAWMHSGEGIHIFPDADNLFMIKALIEGPKNTPFEGGTFGLTVKVPQNYPFSAPQIQFDTPIYHCNVSDSGKICLDILYSGWSPTLSIPKVIEAVRIMLITPDTNNALRQWIAELTLMHRQSGGADTRYFDAATAATKANASLTIAEWKTLWGVA